MAAATNQNPVSPEFSRKEASRPTTPSNEPESSQEFFGRRRLRIINGQEPEKHPGSGNLRPSSTPAREGPRRSPKLPDREASTRFQCESKILQIGSNHHTDDIA